MADQTFSSPYTVTDSHRYGNSRKEQVTQRPALFRMLYRRKKMKCKYCGCAMEKDDVDFRFEGNEDIYWVCPDCNSVTIEKIRYFRSIGTESMAPEYAFHEWECTKDGKYMKCKHCGDTIPLGFKLPQDVLQSFCKVAYIKGKEALALSGQLEQETAND